MLVFKLNHINKRGSWEQHDKVLSGKETRVYVNSRHEQKHGSLNIVRDHL